MRISVQNIGWLLGVLLALPSFVTQAREIRYVAALHESHWQLKASRSECVLSHAIPDYGQARIVQRHGRAAQLSINLIPEASLADYVVIRVVPSSWNHRANPVELGQQSLPMGSTQLVFAADTSLSMITALERGMNLEFSYRPGSSVVAVVSAVRFIPAMNDFYACAAKLAAPVLVQEHTKPAAAAATQTPAVSERPKTKPVFVSTPTSGIALAYSSVEFAGQEDALSEAALSTLTGIAREFLRQQQSKKVYIVLSGNSPSDTAYKSRAAVIAAHLTSQGIPAEAIRTIGRGQLPKVKNVRPEQPPANTLQIHLMQ